VKAIFLDVDDTLVDYETAARASFHATLGKHADYDQFRSLDHYERYLGGLLTFGQMREQRMADYLAMIDHAGDPVHLERQRYDGLAEHYRLFDDALPCVDALKERGLLVGLITNNESVHQRAKIAKVGLEGLFDAVVISGEVGVSKPDAEIFAHACALLDVAASDAMHVGDNRYADAEGAVAAGLRGVWLDRRGQYDGEPVGYDVITSLRELPDLVG
jgi:putative hydrolase of the HAD superfamily